MKAAGFDVLVYMEANVFASKDVSIRETWREDRGYKNVSHIGMHLS